MTEENVILVNEKDEQIGLMPKMEAHEKGILHRAFSVFIFNNIHSDSRTSSMKNPNQLSLPMLHYSILFHVL